MRLTCCLPVVPVPLWPLALLLLALVQPVPLWAQAQPGEKCSVKADAAGRMVARCNNMYGLAQPMSAAEEEELFLVQGLRLLKCTRKEPARGMLAGLTGAACLNALTGEAPAAGGAQALALGDGAISAATAQRLAAAVRAGAASEAEARAGLGLRDAAVLAAEARAETLQAYPPEEVALDRAVTLYLAGRYSGGARSLDFRQKEGFRQVTYQTEFRTMTEQFTLRPDLAVCEAAPGGRALCRVEAILRSASSAVPITGMRFYAEPLVLVLETLADGSRRVVGRCNGAGLACEDVAPAPVALAAQVAERIGPPDHETATPAPEPGDFLNLSAFRVDPGDATGAGAALVVESDDLGYGYAGQGLRAGLRLVRSNGDLAGLPLTTDPRVILQILAGAPLGREFWIATETGESLRLTRQTEAEGRRMAVVGAQLAAARRGAVFDTGTEIGLRYELLRRGFFEAEEAELARMAKGIDTGMWRGLLDGASMAQGEMRRFVLNYGMERIRLHGDCGEGSERFGVRVTEERRLVNGWGATVGTLPATSSDHYYTLPRLFLPWARGAEDLHALDYGRHAFPEFTAGVRLMQCDHPQRRRLELNMAAFLDGGPPEAQDPY